MKGSNYLKLESIIDIMESLIEMKYVDYEIIHLTIKKIEKILRIPEEKREKFEERNYQIEKKNYYNKSQYNIEKNLIENDILNSNIKKIQTIHNKMIENKKI